MKLPRQRLRARAGFSGVTLALTLVLCAALIWYGLMLVLLTLGVSPGLVNDISGYRTAFDFLSGLGAEDFDTQTRRILAGIGLAVFLVFGFLTLKSLPSPYLARHGLDLEESDRGGLEIDARALERLAEIASVEHEATYSARARATADRLEVDVGMSRADLIDSDLEQIRDRVRDALDDHGLPLRAVDVRLTDFDATQRTGALE